MAGARRLHGVVVTYRRPSEVRTTIDLVAAQTRPPDTMVVVDNAPSPDLEAWVRSRADHIYLPMPENTGPAGGLAAGIGAVLDRANEDDLIVLIDDDDPPPDRETLARHLAVLADDESRSIAGVGIVGARYSTSTGLVQRISDEELESRSAAANDLLDVDYLGGNMYGTYRVSAVRAVGGPDPTMFFGFDDLEFGLRLRAAGYRLVTSANVMAERRRADGRLGLGRRPAAAALPPWRRYYSSRSIVRIAHEYGGPLTVSRVAIAAGPVAGIRYILLHRDLRGAWMALRGVLDGLLRRAGRTVDPP